MCICMTLAGSVAFEDHAAWKVKTLAYDIIGIGKPTGAYRLSRIPSEGLAATLFLDRHMPIELDSIGNVQALYLPGVAKVQPVVRLFMLEAVMDGLHQHRLHATGCLAVTINMSNAVCRSGPCAWH